MIKFVDVPASSEAEQIEQLLQLTLEKQRKSYKAGTVARRDVHGKSLGTVDVAFHVHGNIPESVKVGLFAKPESYDGVLRFSNGAFGADAFDFLPNIRGSALKLFGVPGQKALLGEENSTEHDFLMANDRGFFMQSLDQYLLLSQSKMRELVLNHPGVPLRILRAMKIVKNPLFTDYFSQVPYQYGDYACHYFMVADEHAPFYSLPNAFDRHYLRHGVANVLSKRSTKFQFGVQFQRAGESIADSTKVWGGKFVTLATVEVTRRSKPLLESDGEGLSFNPFRVLPEHQPLGWVGRTRRAVYAADFAWRKQMNEANGN